ncbi:uncharacterized protein LOC143916421 [Arctopsyche grandis]|uniref:uncharacterized protein LOC143916421 n=1 Tax=Arctopsyche grandis TaxID=121162 RepID=UPI00406D64F6
MYIRRTHFVFNMKNPVFFQYINIFMFMATIIHTSCGQIVCTTPSNQSGVCVLTNACPHLDNIMKSRNRTPEEAKLLQRSICGNQDGLLKTCCENPTKLLPSYVSVCKRNNPQINKCLKEQLNSIMPLMLNGDLENGLMQIEPTYLPHLLEGNFISQIGMNLEILNVSMTGLSKFIADETMINFTEKKIIVNGKFSQIKLDGKIKLVIPSFSHFTPTGETNGIFEIAAKFVIDYKLNTIGNNTYKTFTKVDTKLTIKEIENRLNLGFMSQEFRICKDQSCSEITPAWEREFSSTILTAANNFVSLYTYDQLFPEA